jgi:branched-chain amino acid transport system permease protein
MSLERQKRLSKVSRTKLLRLAPPVVCLAVLLVVPPFLSTYVRSLLAESLIFAILAMSLDIVMGYTGLISLGHAAYFGVAGYVIGALTLHFDISNFWLSAPLAVLIAGLAAAILGPIALRVSGLYFLLITFAIGQLLYSVAFNTGWLKTPGSEVITGILKPDMGIPGFTWDSNYFYYFVFIAFIVCLFLIRRIVNSPFGHALQGIRECEPRMRSMGYNTWLYKYIAFVFGGIFAGVAGVLFVYYNGMTVPSFLDVSTSALVMLMVIIGGTGTLYGPCIGAVVMIFLQFGASVYTTERWPLILGGAFVAAILWLRGGIIVHLSRLWNKVAYGSVKNGSVKS